MEIEDIAPKNEAHTMLISDVHIRSMSCRAKLLLKTLKEWRFKRLIIVGDLIEDDWSTKELVKINWHQFQLIEYLRSLLQKGPAASGPVEMIRIRGNHDPAERDFITEIMGIESVERYRWTMNGKALCAIHGNQFDRIIFKNPALSRMTGFFIVWFHKIDTHKRFFSRLLNRYYDRWMRLGEMVAEGAKKYAEREGVDVIFCGHVHRESHQIFNGNGRAIEYWNTGDWTGKRCSFITLDEAGAAKLHVLEAAD